MTKTMINAPDAGAAAGAVDGAPRLDERDLLKRLADDAAFLESKGFVISSIREARARIRELEAAVADYNGVLRSAATIAKREMHYPKTTNWKPFWERAETVLADHHQTWLRGQPRSGVAPAPSATTKEGE